jgi:F0F1-type ATP synthase assembly protein I
MDEQQRSDLELIEQRINKLRETKSSKKQNKLSGGTNILIELGAAIGVGLLVGWYIDSTFDTKPLGMTLCTIFGFLAGVKKLMSNR